MKRRVKITGLGFVTPAGIGKSSFNRGIREHVSHVRAVQRFPQEAGSFVASEVGNFTVGNFNIDVSANRLPRHTQFALAATNLAISDAGISYEAIRGMEPLIAVGTSLMDSDLINKTIEAVTLKGPRFAIPRVIFQGPVASIGSALAQSIGGGRTLTFQSACCSGLDAIGNAASMIASGETDIAICGGTEAPIYYHPMLELKMAGLSPGTDERPGELSRPFDLWRTTGVIGEGACIAILEPEASVRRGYAYVSGYSFYTDATLGSADGLYEAIRLCAANARVSSGEIELISAWGPGHREIDAAETRALHSFFGARIAQIPVYSIKGAIGNPFAAAGAIQVGCAALGLRESFAPPTVNWQHPDPECRLNLSPEPRFCSFSNTLVNAHGLSGANSSLLLSRCD